MSRTAKIDRIVSLLEQLVAQDDGSANSPAPQENARHRHFRSSLEATSLLAGDAPALGNAESLSADAGVADGRYQGSAGAFFIDLRVDFGDAQRISGDIFRGYDLEAPYAASFVTKNDIHRDGVKQWAVTTHGAGSETFDGTLTFTDISGTAPTLSGKLRIEGGVAGLGAGVTLNFTANRTSTDGLRSLKIEIKRERGIGAPRNVITDGTTHSLKSAFENVGFETKINVLYARFEENEFGWLSSELHHALSDLEGEAPDWDIRLLMLGRPNNLSAFGIMFDDEERRGAAVFTREIERAGGGRTRERILHAAIHEVGHALNLKHPFEGLPSSPSLSSMNYPQKFSKGLDAFWEDFSYQLSPDDRRFLMHAPRSAVIPGGVPFGAGDRSDPALTMPGRTSTAPLELRIEPPTGGPVLAFGQPVFVTVSLGKTVSKRIVVPASLLDIKGQVLQIWICREKSTFTPHPEFARFRPMESRCYDPGLGKTHRITKTRPLENNVNLTFGTDGFAFAEPGAYRVFAVLHLPSADIEGTDLGRTMVSNVLTLRIGYPHTAEEEHDALTLFNADAGRYFAFGGSRHYPEIADQLDAIEERRMHKRRVVDDPIVANIVRCKALLSSHRFALSSDSRTYRVHECDFETASGLMNKIAHEDACAAFDRCTVRGMHKFKKRCSKQAKR